METGVKIIWDTKAVRALNTKYGREKTIEIIAGTMFKESYVADMVRMIVSPHAGKEITTIAGTGRLGV